MKGRSGVWVCDDRGLERQPRPAAEGAGLFLAGVADRDVDPGQALVELVARRHLPRHEAEVEEDPGRHRWRGQVEGQARRHPAEEDRGQAQEELALLRLRLPLQDRRHLRETRGSLLRIAVHHVGHSWKETSGGIVTAPRGGSRAGLGAATIARPLERAAAMRFEISHTGGTAHEVELDGSVVVLGRDPGCDIVLNDPKCSRRHAVVEEGPEGIVVRDSGSANGISVNGRRVEKVRLRPGDVLRLGDAQVTLLAEIGETVVMAPDDLDPGTAPGLTRPAITDLDLRPTRRAAGPAHRPEGRSRAAHGSPADPGGARRPSVTARHGRRPRGPLGGVRPGLRDRQSLRRPAPRRRRARLVAGRPRERRPAPVSESRWRSACARSRPGPATSRSPAPPSAS